MSPLGDITFKILVLKSLDFKVYCHSALLPSSHHLQKHCFEKTRIQWLIKEIEAAKECEGIRDEELVKYGDIPSKDTSKRFYKHVDSKPMLEKQTAPVLYSTCVRSCECSDDNICGPCKTVEKYLKQKLRIENNVMSHSAQVMSHSVSSVMEAYCPAESFETAKFRAIVDRFFDCMNSRSLNEAERKPWHHIRAKIIQDLIF